MIDIKNNIENSKKIIQKIFPKSWIEQMQYMQSSIVIQWILHNRSKSLAFTKKSVMVFSPHQDDETFGCGGMIALKREYEIPVVVVFMTDGHLAGSSETNSQDKLVTIRKQEAITALTILGVEPSKIYFLDKADGQLSNLATYERQQTIEQIGELLKIYQPEEVYVPHCKDCHRDHEATYELVKEAIKQAGIIVEMIQYPIWFFWKAPIFIMLKLHDIAAAYFISISSAQEKKSKAISAYGSQLNTLNNGFVKQFLGSHEIFFKSE